MEITINEKDDRLVASLIGDLDNSASSMAEKELAPLLERDDCDIELDCRELDYISSSGLRILLNIYKSTRRNGRRAFISHLNEEVADVFRIGGFLQLFEVIE